MQPSGRKPQLDIEIVGLAQDAKYSDVKDAIPPQYLPAVPAGRAARGMRYFYVRTATPPEQLLSAIPASSAKLDSNLPVERPEDDGGCRSARTSVRIAS